jgi:hypothetical protein
VGDLHRRSICCPVEEVRRRPDFWIGRRRIGPGQGGVGIAAAVMGLAADDFAGEASGAFSRAAISVFAVFVEPLHGLHGSAELLQFVRIEVDYDFEGSRRLRTNHPRCDCSYPLQSKYH